MTSLSLAVCSQPNVNVTCPPTVFTLNSLLPRFCYVKVHHIFWSETRYPGAMHTKQQQTWREDEIISDSCRVTSSKMINIHKRREDKHRLASRLAGTRLNTMGNSNMRFPPRSHSRERRKVEMTVQKRILESHNCHISNSILTTIDMQGAPATDEKSSRLKRYRLNTKPRFDSAI
ncbi:hypothetical protein BDV11DRAFT_144532 [Aspergillus similis]